jgi:hypothetical protein
VYALVFGLFLGLAIVKFGNPVILEQILTVPKSWAEVENFAWPISWANWTLVALAVIGAAVAVANGPRWRATRWLWILPLIWFGWQALSATQTQHQDLAAPTLWQFGGCVACYFLGTFVIGRERAWRFLLVGLLAGFAFCLVRAVDQKVFEFPRERQYLKESQQAGWTNMPPEVFLQLKHENVIINTNGEDVLNPVILAKYEKGRVSGTLVYPNALSGVVLLLFPVSLAAIWLVTRNLRPVTRWAAMGLTVFLGMAGLFWSGSKGGWLIALCVGVFWLWQLNWPRRLKWTLMAVVIAGGLVAFGVRFHSYFAKGATSAGARFDYWRVAARLAMEHPGVGTGPGSFQRPYALLKKPESEMARLVHNDYLEQFSDSGMVGGVSYALWVGLLLWRVTRGRVNPEVPPTERASLYGSRWLEFGMLAGVLGWFVQGLMEFSLYVPALAWTAFTLGGCLLARTGNEFDKPKVKN